MAGLKHIHHLEDLFIADGEEGFKKSIEAINKITAYIAGIETGKMHLNTKFDGSPSIVFGRHPTHANGQWFFISTKSFWNKKPLYAFTASEIYANFNPAIHAILVNCFRELQDEVKTGIFQGDFLFHNTSLDTVTPNLLNYTFSSKYWKSKYLCISLHTEYEYKDGEYIQSSNVDWDKITKSGQKYFHNPQYEINDYYVKHELLGNNFVKDTKYHLFNYLREKLQKITHDYYGLDLRYLNKDQLLLFANKMVKTNNYNIEDIADVNFAPELINIFEFWLLLRDVKNSLVSLLNRYRKGDGLDITYTNNAGRKWPTNPEGYVFTGQDDSYPIKLIHRHVFSKLNFDKYSKDKLEKNNEPLGTD
jgi:hypothetical protein